MYTEDASHFRAHIYVETFVEEYINFPLFCVRENEHLEPVNEVVTPSFDAFTGRKNIYRNADPLNRQPSYGNVRWKNSCSVGCDW